MPLSQRKSKLLKRLAVNKSRARERLVLVEGVRAVTEALDAGAVVSFAAASPRLDSSEAGRALRARLETEAEAGSWELVTASDDGMEEVADTEHPQGVVLVCEEPVVDLREVGLGSGPAQEAGEGPPGPSVEAARLAPSPEAVRSTRPRILVIDAVQDPGNVGTLVRSAVAFGFDLVVALDGTTDPWGSKAVRAAAGTVFRISVVRASAVEAVNALSTAGLPILVASAEGSAAVSPPEAGFALVVGNEGAGVREEVRRAATKTVAVPMSGPTESLNVGIAGSILMSDLIKADR